MTTTAELDKQTLQEMNRIDQGIMDCKINNVLGTELLRKLRKQLAEARAEVKGA